MVYVNKFAVLIKYHTVFFFFKQLFINLSDQMQLKGGNIQCIEYMTRSRSRSSKFVTTSDITCYILLHSLN